MPTLQERFADLAEDAPVSPVAPGIWAEGRRRARTCRIGTAVIGVATLVVLLVVAGLAVHRASAPGYAGSDSTPALPSAVYHPSPWLTGWGDRPPGQLSMLIPGKRGGWPHYHWGMVGVSATTGAYHYLEIPGCLDVDGLSPDGRHLSCFAGFESGGHEVINGVAIYDTVTGHVDRWTSPSGTLGLNTVTWSGNGAVAFRAGGTSYLWHFGHAAPRPISTHLTFRVGTTGTAGLYLSGRDGFFYLDPRHDARVQRVTLARSARTTTPAAISPSGRRIVVVHAATEGFAPADRGSTAGQEHARLLVGSIDPSGGRVRLTPVPADVHWPVIVGWADDQHVLVVNQVSHLDSPLPEDPRARYELDSVDVGSGQVVRVARMSDAQTSWGAMFAASLLGAPTRDFPAPPQPINQRLEAGLVVGFLLLGGIALVVWRRRVRA
jgi:hypothetical protein